MTPEHAAHFADLVQWRRDVRRFTKQPIDDATLATVLTIADLAPSVGNSQPWRVVHVVSPELKHAVRLNFEHANAGASAIYNDAQERAAYLALKLAGFDAAPVHLAVFCDQAPIQGRGLGRQTMPEMLAYSCVSMITTLWYAARAEGIGVGWVSILDPDQTHALLKVPENWQLIAYLLIGYPEDNHTDPELERFGWQARTAPAARQLVR